VAPIIFIGKAFKHKLKISQIYAINSS